MEKEKNSIDANAVMKKELSSDEQLAGVVGGAAAMYPPVVPWTCECGTYNAHKKDRDVCIHCGKKKS